jgi:hypothetical protein
MNSRSVFTTRLRHALARRLRPHGKLAFLRALPAGAVMAAMAQALRPGGRLYLAFPSEASVGFSHRRGTLNFFDDPTHQHVPRRDFVLQQNLGIAFARARYRPVLLALAGLVLEPLSWLTGRNDPLGASWALHRFESVLWAERPAGDGQP